MTRHRCRIERPPSQYRLTRRSECGRWHYLTRDSNLRLRRIDRTTAKREAATGNGSRANGQAVSTTGVAHPGGHSRLTSPAPSAKARRAFLRHFPGGFRDPAFLDWERNYKWDAHLRWRQQLAQERFEELLGAGRYLQIAQLAVSIESRTNLLFSFEKMALRDAIRSRAGARTFATGLYKMLYGAGSLDGRFDQWRAAVGELPRRQTRVLTWPVLTVFPFLAQPSIHLYLKPVVTRVAATAYGYPFRYSSVPNLDTYKDLLSFGRGIRRDLKDLRPRDQIDIQSFIWVLGSDEYS